MTTKTYKLNEINQLIELNGDKTNFEIDFDIVSKNKEPFKAKVISESDLNSGKKIEYQIVENGIISGKVINDKGVFQSYFLLLKSDKPTECNVTINLKEIPINTELQKEEMLRQRKLIEEQLERQNPFNITQTKQKNTILKYISDYWRIGVLCIIVLCIIVLGLAWFINKNKNVPLTEDAIKVPEVPEANLQGVSTQDVNFPEVSLPMQDVSLPNTNLLNNITSPQIDSGIPPALNKNNTVLADKLRDYFGS
jgi:hypothetical protein